MTWTNYLRELFFLGLYLGPGLMITAAAIVLTVRSLRRNRSRHPGRRRAAPTRRKLSPTERR